MRAMHRRTFTTMALAIGVFGSSAATASANLAEDDIVLGDPVAKVTVVEYLSPSAIWAAEWHRDVFPQVRSTLVDTGRVGWALREMVTLPENFSVAGFLLARRVGRDRYLPMIEAIFAAHAEIYRTGDFEGVLRRIAGDFGLSVEEYRACLTDEAAIKAIYRRSEAAEAAGVVGVPEIVVGDNRFQGSKVATLSAVTEAVTRAEAG